MYAGGEGSGVEGYDGSGGSTMGVEGRAKFVIEALSLTHSADGHGVSLAAGKGPAPAAERAKRGFVNGSLITAPLFIKAVTRLDACKHVNDWRMVAVGR